MEQQRQHGGTRERALSTREASTATMTSPTSLATNAICFSWNSKPLIACRVVISYFSLLSCSCTAASAVRCVSQRWKGSNLRECAALHELGDDPELVQSGVGRDKSNDVGVVHPLEEVNFAQIAELIAWVPVLHLLHRHSALANRGLIESCTRMTQKKVMYLPLQVLSHVNAAKSTANRPSASRGKGGQGGSWERTLHQPPPAL